MRGFDMPTNEKLIFETTHQLVEIQFGLVKCHFNDFCDRTFIFGYCFGLVAEFAKNSTLSDDIIVNICNSVLVRSSVNSTEDIKSEVFLSRVDAFIEQLRGLKHSADFREGVIAGIGDIEQWQANKGRSPMGLANHLLRKHKS